MGIGEFLFGKRQEQPIDKIGESEQNRANREGERSFEKQAIIKEAEMLEGKAVGKRKTLMKKAVLAISLLAASPAGAAEFGEIVGRIVETGIDRAGRVIERGIEAGVSEHESDNRLYERRVEVGGRSYESDNRRKESMHRDDADTKRRQYEVGGNVAETTTREEEQSKREGYRYGAHEIGSETDVPGPYGNVHRKRSSDVIGRPQRGQAPTSPLPGESEPEEEKPYAGGSHELSERERDALAARAVKDYQRGVPSADFERMPEEEREVYGHAWNSMEKNIGKTGIILRPMRR